MKITTIWNSQDGDARLDGIFCDWERKGNSQKTEGYTEEIIKSVEQENKNLKITALHAVGDPANKAGRIIVIKFSTSLKSCFGMGVLQ